MTNYIIRRLFSCVLLVILVSMVIFMLIRMLPGDPIDLLLPREDMIGLTAEQLQAHMDALRAEHGLDRPLPIQFGYWFINMLQGDFGRSIVRGFEVGPELANRMAVTLFLGSLAFIFSIVFGILLGTISAIRRGKWVDTVATAIANIGITAPAFLIAILLIYVFGFRLRLLPIFGYHLPWRGDFVQSIRQTILPVFVLALSPMALTARQTRSSVLDVLNQDHVRTAWAKGGRERAVIFRHVLKNALTPVITLQGNNVRLIFGGSAIIESIFVIPGVGRLLVDSMLSADYPVVQAIAVVLTLITVIANLIVDLLYGWVDPRIQYS
ncbi:MAG: ABC transporter permease [Oscillospiraceae bacterium]|nr:ABC transporter permease [Oscillospiraceae bacterium]